jgi:hypothetical protein
MRPRGLISKTGPIVGSRLFGVALLSDLFED